MSFFRAATRVRVLPATPLRFQPRQLPRLVLPTMTLQRATYAAAASGERTKEIEARIVEILRGFEKVDQAKLTPTSTFQQLALDSLDAVEVVMAIEEEFSIEIPDDDADAIDSVKKAIEYIQNTPTAS